MSTEFDSGCWTFKCNYQDEHGACFRTIRVNAVPFDDYRAAVAALQTLDGWSVNRKMPWLHYCERHGGTK